ncbi:MAG: biotin transporter BioY [Clostridia bacterium]|nr:biotin transporter BioY [Clostridia bacterium]
MKTRNMILAAMFGALTAVGAIVAVPLPTPIPFTMQIFFVVLAGILLGPHWGAVSQLVYILMGSLGLPVFAGGTSGFMKLVGPSGGYLTGFIIAALVVGLITRKRPNTLLWNLTASLAGLTFIYLVGTTQLALVAGLSPGKAIAAGVAPFILFDLIKITAAGFLGVAVKSALIKVNLLEQAN